MSIRAQGARSLGEWMDVLEQIERTLQQSFALPPEPPAPAPLAPEALLAPLQALDARVARWQACIDQAEHNALQADAVLAEELRAFEEWGQALPTVKEKLAKVVGAG